MEIGSNGLNRQNGYEKKIVKENSMILVALCATLLFYYVHVIAKDNYIK